MLHWAIAPRSYTVSIRVARLNQGLRTTQPSSTWAASPSAEVNTLIRAVDGVHPHFGGVRRLAKEAIGCGFAMFPKHPTALLYSATSDGLTFL